jgi:hypothetical protein
MKIAISAYAALSAALLVGAAARGQPVRAGDFT